MLMVASLCILVLESHFNYIQFLTSFTLFCDICIQTYPTSTRLLRHIRNFDSGEALSQPDPIFSSQSLTLTALL